MSCSILRSPRPTSLTVALAALLIAPALATTTGCAEDEGKGSLIVPVVLGPDLRCDEVEVASIRASLGDDAEYINEIDCEDASPREIRIDKVPAGKYELLLEGIDAEGVTVMDNLDETPSERRVEVLGDGASVTAATVTLTNAPARLEVTVDFMASSCSASGIDRFEVRAFAGADALLAYELDCDDDVLGTTVIPDEGRDLNGDRFGDFIITPLDKSGATVGASLSPAMPFPPPGRGRVVGATLLDCDENGCPDLDFEIRDF